MSVTTDRLAALADALDDCDYALWDALRSRHLPARLTPEQAVLELDEACGQLWRLIAGAGEACR